MRYRGLCCCCKWYAPWLANSVEVELAGGKLQIEWQEGDVVWMTGPTTHVYDGRLDLRYFQG